MIQYIENPKDFIQKLPDLISEYSKVVEYEINVHKFLHTTNKISERECKKKVSFKITLKRKNLGINLITEVKD